MAVIEGSVVLSPVLAITASPPPVNWTPVALSNLAVAADMEDGGPGEIRGELPAGLVTFDGTPGHARVYVLARLHPRVIRATRSNADGTYRLTNLKLGVEYTVLARDERNIENAVVMDRVQAGVPDHTEED